MTVISSVCVSVTALPLSKCWRTHYGGHCELFSGQNALDRMILHMHSTSAWCQLGNELRIVNGGSGQWKRLRSRMGHALDDDDDDDDRTISFFWKGGWYPGLPWKRLQCLDRDTNFRLARQRFHFSCLQNDNWSLSITGWSKNGYPVLFWDNLRTVSTFLIINK